MLDVLDELWVVTNRNTHHSSGPPNALLQAGAGALGGDVWCGSSVVWWWCRGEREAMRLQWMQAWRYASADSEEKRAKSTGAQAAHLFCF